LGRKQNIEENKLPSGDCGQNPKLVERTLLPNFGLKIILYLNTHFEANSTIMTAELKIKIGKNYLSHCASSAEAKPPTMLLCIKDTLSLEGC
jgi:hypothetical protein